MAFFAVRLPTDVIEGIDLPHLRGQYPELRWELPADLHMTLRFFADGRTETMQRLVQATSDLPSFPRFKLKLAKASVFDRRSRGGVLWLGLENIPEHLAALQSGLEVTARQLGFAPEDRPFAPHVTLARYESKDRNLIEDILERLQTFESREFEVSALHLMKRVPGLDSAVYGDLLKLSAKA